jgi:cytochrome c-type biogenesis protein
MAYSSERGKLRPLAIVIGLCISFTAMGVIFSAFGSVVYAYRGYMETIAEIMIIALGIVMLFDLPVFDRLSALAPQLAPQTTQGEGLFGGLLLGLSLGIVWMPCLGPLIGSVLMTVIPEGDVLYGGTRVCNQHTDRARERTVTAQYGYQEDRRGCADSGRARDGAWGV